ncbi:hypothetical protein BGZ58_006840, partial [Dissophora ornata]
DAEDVDGFLASWESFSSTLQELYGDQHYVEENNHKLIRLRQANGSVTEYITKFRTLSARSGWNEAALLSRFREGLSDEVTTALLSQWHSFTTLRSIQSAAITAYQNLQAQSRSRPRQASNRGPYQPQPQRRIQVTSPPVSSSTAMELDAMRL